MTAALVNPVKEFSAFRVRKPNWIILKITVHVHIIDISPTCGELDLYKVEMAYQIFSRGVSNFSKLATTSAICDQLL